MRELITVGISFLIVVALAFYMYTGTQKHSIATIENNRIEGEMSRNYEVLKLELEELKAHVREIDSIYHKK